MSIKVSWFIPTSARDFNHVPASVWIRCLQLISYLEARGIKSYINEPTTDTDLSIFVRWQDEQAYCLASEQKAKGQKVVFDLCVNYFDTTPAIREGSGVADIHIEQTMKMLSISDLVICASQFIKERAQEYHGWAEYVPDSIDFNHFHHLKAKEDYYRPALRAVWSGVSAKLEELSPIIPLLQKHRIKLVVISDKERPLQIKRWLGNQSFDYDFIKWSYETFPKNILSGEIALSYRLLDTAYNQGHSFYKIGVLMAEGIPAIAVPQPSYREIISTDTGGQICESIAEWDAVLKLVSQDRDRLVRWSKEANIALQPYSTAQISDQYVALFKRCIEIA